MIEEQTEEDMSWYWMEWYENQHPNPDIRQWTIESAIEYASEKHGILYNDLLALHKQENGGMKSQAQSNLWVVYWKDKANSLSAHCNIQKREGNFPDWVDCTKEQSFWPFQINLDPAFKRGITIEQALDYTFSAEWASKKLLSNGYDKNAREARYHAIHCYNGCALNATNHWYPQNILSYSDSLKTL